MRKLQKPIALLLVACMLFGLMAVGVSAVEISQKPANGNTVGQPFAPYTGGSQNFRIPGIVTLDNGTLIAACDARWNHSGDHIRRYREYIRNKYPDGRMRPRRFR